MEEAAAVPTALAPRTGRRTRTRTRALPSGAALLSLGTLASGVLAYAFNLLAARALGPAAYGPVAVLWAAMFLISVVLFRPVEQTLSRSLAERRAHGAGADLGAAAVRRAVGRLTLVLLGTVVACLLIAWGPVTERLFAGRDALTASLVLGIAGYALSYYVRGLASGVEWLGGYGALLLVDGAARVAFALPLVFVASPAVAGIAIAGAAVAGALVPLARRDRLVDRTATLSAGGTRTPAANAPAHRASSAAAVASPATGARPFALAEALRFALPVGVVAASEQVLVSGGALLVSLTGGAGAAAAAGTVFAATMLVRAPVFLFQGVAAALLPRFTRATVTGGGARVRRQLLAAAGIAGTIAVTLALGALALGPEIMRLLFGAGFDVARGDLAVLSAGVGSYLLAATVSQAVLAAARAGAAALAWATAAGVFVAVELSLDGDPFHRVSIAFTAATTLAALALGLLVTVGGRRPPPGTTTGVADHKAGLRSSGQAGSETR